MNHRKVDVSRLTTLRVRGVQNDVKFVLKCTTETDKIETSCQRRGTSELTRWLYGGSCVRMYYIMLTVRCFFVFRLIVKHYCTTTKGFSLYEFKNSPVVYIFK